MIKLTRGNKPEFLSDLKKAELTEAFKRDGLSVWNHPEIKSALLISSNGKCAFCECSITAESKYLEVEHFEIKSKYPDRVVDWENLLPACKRCNVAKGIHDTRLESLVDPYAVDPRDHLCFRSYRLRGRTNTGKTTIDVLDLNNSARLVTQRFEIGEQAIGSIAIAKERFESYLESRTAVRRNKLLGIVETILTECQPTAIYSAGAAATVFNDPDFIELVDAMKAEGVWFGHLQDLYEKGNLLALELV
ncbi:MAG: HNH endonuclease [Burkholderia sp.]